MISDSILTEEKLVKPIPPVESLQAVLASVEGFQVPLIITVAGAVIAAILVWLLPRLGRLVVQALGNLGLSLWTRRPLRGIAVREFRRRVCAAYGTVTNIYLQTEDQLSLDQVFVPLKLHERGASRRPDDAPLTRDARGVISHPEQRQLMILGDPGSGKTTLLRALAAGVGQRQWPELDALVPVYVRLRAYAQTVGRQDGQPDQPPDLWDWICRQVRTEHNVKHARRLLDTLRRDGRLLLLLDGLDEVGEAAARWIPARITALAEQRQEQPGTRIIVSCREQNYGLLEAPDMFPRTGFSVFRLAEMRDAELESMVGRRAPHFKAAGKSIPRFLGKVRAAPSVADLHRNPLLLTLSIGLYLNRPDDRVPNDLAEFYDEGIKNLLRRHDFGNPDDRRQGIRRRNQTSHRDKFALLQRFGLKTLVRATEHDDDFEVWPVADLIQEAREMAGHRLGISANEAETLVDEIHRHAGLITDTGDGEHFCFAHRSLHEFCAARRLGALGEAGFEHALDKLDEPDWTQVLTFYASLEHDYAERLVETLLKRGVPRHPGRLALAGQCAAVMIDPLVELRLRVARTMGQALLAQPDPRATKLLIDALIRLGRDAAEPVRAEVEQTIRTLLNMDRPERIAEELGRLDQATAMDIIGLLIDSGEPERLHTALIGIEAMDGVERVPVLWRLIAALAERTDMPLELERVLALMGVMLDDPRAAQRLLVQPPLLADRITRNDADVAYPFTVTEQTASNLAYLAALFNAAPAAVTRVRASLTAEDEKGSATPWAQLFLTMTSPREHQPSKHWARIALDRTTKLWRVQRRTAARFLLFVILVIGGWQFAKLAYLYPAVFTSAIGFKTVIAIAFICALVGAFALGFAEALTRRFGWSTAQRGALPSMLSGWLDAYQALDDVGPPQLGQWRNKSITRSVFGIVATITAFGFANIPKYIFVSLRLALPLTSVALLIPVSMYLAHPSPAGHLFPITGLAFTSGGARLASASLGGELTIFDANEGTELAATFLRPSAITIHRIDAAPRESLLLITSSGETLLWDVGTNAPLASFPHAEYLLTDAKFAPYGPRIMISTEHELYTFDAITRQRISHSSIESPGAIYTIAISPQADAFFFGGKDIAFIHYLEDLAKPRFLAAGYTMSADFSDDGRVLALASPFDLSTWCVQTGTNLMQVFQYNQTMVDISPDGLLLLSNDGRKTTLRDVLSGEVFQQFEHESHTFTAAFSPDGTRIAVGMIDGNISVFDIETGETIWNTSHRFTSILNLFDLKTAASFSALFVLFFVVPITKPFDRGKWLYLWPLRPNPYLYLYDLPGIEDYIPVNPRR